MTAALYAKRSGKSVKIFEKESFGGQIANSPKVENFPSIKEISGLELSNNMFEQIMDLGVEFECEDVLEVKKENDCFIVTTDYNTYLAKAVIIAAGVKHRTMGVEREEELVGKGVSYCAVCDGAFYKGKDVAVIGDANTALQYTLMLSDICNKVYLCMLFDKFFADQTLVNRLNDRNNIVVTKEILLKEFLGRDELTGLKFEHTKTNEPFSINCEAVFIAIGQVPNNERYSNLVDIDERGYIVSTDTTTKTPGLYVAGDCRTKNVRQLTTAVGDGAIAAMNAVNYINNLK
jgi:thioredoxin reductase (NADPH)